MFHLSVPLLEKILRPAVAYIFLICCLRLFGKRELAQLNPFDLVVLLCLSNTVQNAMIGDDTSVTGGLIGALSLLSVNWLLSKLIYRAPRLSQALGGSSTTLIHDGVVDRDALRRESLTPEELIGVLHRNNHNRPEEIQLCSLEPNGTFYVQGMHPDEGERQTAELQKTVEALTLEVRLMREALNATATNS